MLGGGSGRVLGRRGRVLTAEWDGRVCGASSLHLPQAQQGGREQRVVDEVLHIVSLTFLLGPRTHLVCHVLPGGGAGHGAGQGSPREKLIAPWPQLQPSNY